ncbi:Hypp4232 [Branchiostoma lanceolatum]|uniref:Hypp4232 protein n=1 Tax=Branchiostoma lanceolatum TaxID=7740 RepID=A0A8K0A5J9_BRALA|nr:Hypp4232 [Branchiostoma lanceolatum]
MEEGEESETPRTLIRGVLAHLPVSDSAVKAAAGTSRERRSSVVDALRASASAAKKRRISTASPRTLIRGVLETQPTPENTTEEPARKVARVTPQVRGQPTQSHGGSGQRAGATFASPSGSAPRSLRQSVRRSARISTSSPGSAYFTRRQVGRVSSLLTPQDDSTPHTLLRNVLQVLPVESPVTHSQAEVSLLEESIGTPTVEEPVREQAQVQQSAQPTPEIDLSLTVPRRGTRHTHRTHITLEQFAAGVEQRLASQEAQTEEESSDPTGDSADQTDAAVSVEETSTPAGDESRHIVTAVDVDETDSAQPTSSQETTSQTEERASSCDGDDEMSSQQDRNAGSVEPDFIFTQETKPDEHTSSQSQGESDEEDFIPETQMSVQQDDHPSAQDADQTEGPSSAAGNDVSDGERSADQTGEILSDDDMFEDRAAEREDENQNEEVEEDDIEIEEDERVEDDDMSEEENIGPGDEVMVPSGAEHARSPQKVLAQQQVRPVRQKRRKAPPSNNSLPRAYTKSIFTNFCKRPVSKDAMEEVEKGCEKFFQNLSKDLMVYTRHGHRQTIQEADVELLMRRQGLVTEKQSLNSLIEKYLPLEDREQLIPMATSGNKLVPQNSKGNK